MKFIKFLLAIMLLSTGLVEAQPVLRRLTQIRDVASGQSDGQVLIWVAANNRWEPGSNAGAGLGSLADDGTPELGGNLDMLAFLIEGVDATEMSHLVGVTSGIQTQINGKQASSSDLDALVALGNGLFVKTDGSGAPTGQATIASTDLASTTGTGGTVVLSASPTLTGTLTVPRVESTSLALASTSGSGSTLTIDASTPAMSVDGGNTHEFTIDGGSLGVGALPVFFETEAIISTGAISIDRGYHKVDTEADAATDDLATINFSYTYAGGSLRTGSRIYLTPENGARTVVIKDGTGNIETQGGTDITLDDAEDVALLIYDDDVNTWYASLLGGGTGGSGAYSDATPVVLNTTTKDVIIAGASQINSAKASIDGDSDQVQLAIQGHSTQTSNLIELENNAGTVVWSVDVTGAQTVASLTVTDSLSLGSIEFEGATADANETTLDVVDPTSDNTVNLPDASGTLATVGFFSEQLGTTHTVSIDASTKEGYDSIHYITAATTITLPAVTAGTSFTFISTGANTITIDANASDLIILDGVTLDDGDSIDSAGAAGDIVVITYYNGTGWFASSNGFSDGGPS